MIGDATYGQVALFFSLIGMLNAALLWPVSLGLFLTGLETLHWDRLPWPALLSASCLSLGENSPYIIYFDFDNLFHLILKYFSDTCVVFSVANLLGNFSVALTYDLFITLGLITAVPVSAGKQI